MASGSYFQIFRDRPDRPTNRKELRTLLNTKKKMPEFPRFVRLSDYEYADTKQRFKLDLLFQANFCSTLNMLRDHFELNPYADNRDKASVELSYNQVHAMWQATQYLIYGDYSKKTEALMDNCYVRIFRQLSADYMTWRAGDAAVYEDEVDTDTLYRLSDVLRTIKTLLAEVEEPTRLRVLYTAW